MLTVSENGITVPAGPFAITSIVSSTQGAISLAAGSKTLAAGGAETWTIGLTFDPTATGLFQVPLTINSNDPNTPAATVSLLGTGMTPPALLVADSVPPSNDKQVSFGGVDADGAGGQSATQTVTLTDTGQLPILVSQNGITLATGTQFKVTSIVSSTQGTVNLASGPATIAAGSAESWTLTLIFDPSSYGALTDTLHIASNDPVNPTTSIALAGTGLNQPDLNLSGTSLSFPATLDDGSGGRTSTMTFVIKDVGTQALVVAKNGLSLLAGAESQFKIVSIVSSTQSASTWPVPAFPSPPRRGNLDRHGRDRSPFGPDDKHVFRHTADRQQ